MNRPNDSETPFASELSEQFFMQGNVPMAMLTRGEGRFVVINEAFTETFGYGPEQVVGETFAETGFLAGDPFEETEEGLLDGSSRNVLGRKGYVHRKDGEVREVLFITTSLEIGAEAFLACQVIDISRWQFIGQEFLQACEDDLERIGHALKENISQRLAGITLMCQSLLEDMDGRNNPEAAEALHGIREHIKQTHREIEETIGRLQPVGLTGESLGKALELLGEEIERTYEVPCLVEAEDVEVDRPAIAINLYRIAQRAAESAVNHGEAEAVRIYLQQTEQGLALKIQSSGEGLTSEVLEGGEYGLDIMRYRARVIGGHLEIDDDPDSGTIVRCIQPGRDELFAKDQPEGELVDR